MKKTFRVYGRDDHRQRESFRPSYEFEVQGARFSVRNSDLTGTNQYTEIVIEAENEGAITGSLEGQLSDGIFENSHYGRVEEVLSTGTDSVAGCL